MKYSRLTLEDREQIHALVNQGNLLVIPKRHVERFEQLTPQELLELQSEMNLMITTFKEMYGVNDYVILQKNGEKAGQTLAHLHFHIIPVRDPSDKTIERAFQFRERLSDKEMEQNTKELQQFLNKMEIIYVLQESEVYFNGCEPIKTPLPDPHTSS